MIYHKEVPVDIRLIDEDDKSSSGSQELINAKILVQVK